MSRLGLNLKYHMPRLRLNLKYLILPSSCMAPRVCLCTAAPHPGNSFWPAKLHRELLYTKGCPSFPVHTSVGGSGGRTKLVNGFEGERWHGLVSGLRAHLKPTEISGQNHSESNGKLLNVLCQEIHDSYMAVMKATSEKG